MEMIPAEITAVNAVHSGHCLFLSIHSFIHSFSKYSMRFYTTSGNELGTGNNSEQVDMVSELQLNTAEEADF